MTSGRSSNRSGSSRSERFRRMIGDRKELGAHERLGRRLVGLGTRVPVRCEGRTCETDPDVRETPDRTCTSATAHVVVRIVVAPRPPGRRRRAGTGGRGRSDPRFSMPAVASAEVGMCTPSQPSPGVAPGQQSHAGRPPARRNETLSRTCQSILSAALAPPVPWSAMPKHTTREAIGERGFLQPRSGARHLSGTDRWPEQPMEGSGRVVNPHLDPNPYRALGEGGLPPPPERFVQRQSGRAAGSQDVATVAG